MCSFPAYLQGMESISGGRGVCLEQAFPAYLQGMESGNASWKRDDAKEVPSLPTRNGKMDKLEATRGVNFVPSLPTRNGKPFRQSVAFYG